MQATNANRLTIILPLKDKPEFTRRWMRFMDDQSCPYQILIADGGADHGIEAELRESGNYPNLNYEYIRYPFDSEFKYFFKKLCNVCSKVDTDYILFADNDDFYDINYFNKYISFLDQRKDYVGIRGKTALFWINSDEEIKLNSPKGDGYDAIGLSGESIEDSTYVGRIEKFLSEIEFLDHFMNWYSINRTKDVRDALMLLDKYENIDPFIYEFMFFILLLKQGKFKVDEHYSYFRQHGSSQALASLMEVQPLAFRRIFTTNSFSSIYSILGLIENSGIEVSKILTAISKMFERQILEFNRPKSLVQKIKIFYIRYPKIYFVMYEIHKLFMRIFRKKFFLKVDLIERYIVSFQKIDHRK